MLAYVYAKDLPLRLRGPELAYLKPRREEMAYIVIKGIPMGAQMLVMSAAGIIIVGLVNREGLMMTAAYGAAMQLFTYIQMPAMAIGGAVSAMAAQFIGAGKWDRLDKVTHAGVLVNFLMTGVPTVILLVFDRAALGLFLGPGSEAVEIGRHIQLVASWAPGAPNWSIPIIIPASRAPPASSRCAPPISSARCWWRRRHPAK